MYNVKINILCTSQLRKLPYYDLGIDLSPQNRRAVLSTFVLEKGFGYPPPSSQVHQLAAQPARHGGS